MLSAQFLECCKGLIGSRKDWKDSLFLKISIAVALKALVGLVSKAPDYGFGCRKLGIAGRCELCRVTM